MGDEGGDGDDEADDGGVEGFGDALGDHDALGGDAAGADVGEYGDEAGDGAEKAEKGADAGGDFEDDEATFHAGDFGAGLGLDGLHVLGFAPGEVFEADADESGEGGLAGGDVVFDFVGGSADAEAGEGVEEGFGEDEGAAEGDAAFEDEGEGDHRNEEERDHEDAADAEEVDDFIDHGGAEGIRNIAVPGSGCQRECGMRKEAGMGWKGYLYIRRIGFVRVEHCRIRGIMQS